MVAPRLVRPDQYVSVYVSLFRLTAPSVRVSVSVCREQVEQASTSELFTRPGAKLLQLKVSEHGLSAVT